MPVRQYSGQVTEVPINRPGFAVFRMASVTELTVQDTSEGEDLGTSESPVPRVITCVAQSSKVESGAWVLVTGSWKRHDEYGWQFHLDRLRPSMPQHREAIEAYLASGQIEGIGEELARRLVNRFGDQTLEIMERSPASLTVVHGIGEERAQRIAVHVREKRLAVQVNDSMSALGLPETVINELNKKYGDYAYHRIRKNPYEILVGPPIHDFSLARQVALELGYSNPDEETVGLVRQYFGQLPRRTGSFMASLSELSGYVEDNYPEFQSEVSDLAVRVPHPFVQMVSKDSVYLVRASDARYGRQILERLTVKGESSRLRDVLAMARTQGYPGIFPVLPNNFCRSSLAVIDGSAGTQVDIFVRALLGQLEAASPSLTVDVFARTVTRCRSLRSSLSRSVHTLGSAKRTREGVQFQLEGAPDLLILFEAEQITLREVAALSQAAAPDATILLVGDYQSDVSGYRHAYPQILSYLTKRKAAVLLDDVMYSPWHTQFHGFLAHSNPHRWVEQTNGDTQTLADRAPVHFLSADGPDQTVEAVLAILEGVRAEIGEDAVHVLSCAIKGPVGTNALNDALCPSEGALTASDDAPMLEGRRLQVGDRLVSTKAMPGTPWRSGDVGRVASINREVSTVTVELRSGERLDVNYATMARLRLGWATTVRSRPTHPFAVIVLVLADSEGAKAHWRTLYGALSWCNHRLIVVGSRKEFEAMLADKPPAPDSTFLEVLDK